MLRTAFILVFFPLYMLLAGPPILLYTLISRNPNLVYWAGVKGIMAFVRLVGVKVRIKGRERVPSGACLFVANHTSTADAPAVWGAVSPRVAIPRNNALVKWPISRPPFT